MHALLAFIDVDQLPESCGGALAYDHKAWMRTRTVIEGDDDVIPEYSAADEHNERKRASFCR